MTSPYKAPSDVDRKPTLKKAKGDISAPVEMPVTMLKLGRLPVSLHPVSNPAPNAPCSPPPERARMEKSFLAVDFRDRNCADCRRRHSIHPALIFLLTANTERVHPFGLSLRDL